MARRKNDMGMSLKVIHRDRDLANLFRFNRRELSRELKKHFLDYIPPWISQRSPGRFFSIVSPLSSAFRLALS